MNWQIRLSGKKPKSKFKLLRHSLLKKPVISGREKSGSRDDVRKVSRSRLPSINKIEGWSLSRVTLLPHLNTAFFLCWQLDFPLCNILSSTSTTRLLLDGGVKTFAKAMLFSASKLILAIMSRRWHKSQKEFLKRQTSPTTTKILARKCH